MQLPDVEAFIYPPQKKSWNHIYTVEMDGSAYNKKCKSELFMITCLILERKKIMQRKKNVLVMILATVVAMLAMSVNVWAAQKNPLAQMSTKTSAVLYSAPAGMGCDYFTPEYTSKVKISVKSYNTKVATVYKGNIIKNLIMDCQSYTKYRPNETTGGIFVSWRRKEELPTGA